MTGAGPARRIRANALLEAGGGDRQLGVVR